VTGNEPVALDYEAEAEDAEQRRAFETTMARLHEDVIDPDGHREDQR
jgi:hypothetical protein